MNMEKLKEVFSDEAFVKSLFELETAAEVQAALQAKGVELTEEQILGIRDLFTKVESGEISLEQLEEWAKLAESGELTDEMLEQVSGGSVAVGVGTIVGLVAVGVIIVGAIVTSLTLLIKSACEERW